MALNPRSTASVAGHPIHPMLVPFPIAFFVGTLACDLAYFTNRNPDWALATQYTLGAGIIMGLLAAVFGLIDLAGDGRIRALSAVWWHAGGNVLAVLISIANFFIRYESGAAAVLPAGLILSIVVVVILLFTGWLGWEMVYRHRVGVADEKPI